MKIKDIFTVKYGEWKVFYKNDKSKWIGFQGEKGYWYADPTLIKYCGNIYLFTEAFQKSCQIGRIAVSKLENGFFSKPEIIIKKPYHLSYPCVFEYMNKIYMIPETSQNYTLELYCAEDEELHEWKLKKIICKNINCVDTTVFVKDQEVYLITYFQRPNDYSTIVYKLDMDNYTLTELFRKSESENILRPAGKVYQDGDYYRPVQYNKNFYGEKMRILKIDPNKNDWIGVECKQISIDDIQVDSIKRTHTLNSVGEIKVIDGLREYRTFKAPFYVLRRKIHNIRFKITNVRRN